MMNSIQKIIRPFSVGLLFFFVFGSFSIFAQMRAPIYISPNNDGVQDELNIPLSIQEKRYVSEWTFVVTDAEGNIVRTIGNKVALPESLTFSSFFKQLITPKQGVLIPESITWNGIMDSGETAPDGTYNYYVTAADDNANVSKTPLYTVVVDNTAPIVEITQPAVAAKTFGVGSKPDLSIPQTGSKEDLWIAEIIDNTGNAVRTTRWQNAEPSTYVWDGKDNNGIAVSEGVYTYRVSAADRAGNVSDPAHVTNIIYDAIPRAVNMMVQGSPFSPNNDDVQDTISILPSMSTSAGLLNWSIDVKNTAGTTVYSFGDAEEPPTTITFDGKTSNGRTLADGDYQLVFTASFSNGQESVINRNITVDNTPPSAVVRADKSIFSPDGDGRLDTLTVSQEGSKEKTWTGALIDEANNTVKTWVFGETPPSRIEWDGVTDDGQIVDGFYKYVLSSTDLAGNTGTALTSAVELNTGTTEVIITVLPKAFSPNGDQIQDTLTFTPLIRTETGIAKYELTILDASGNILRTFSENRSIPSALTWNGLSDDGVRATDGMYTASLYTLSNNGSEATITTPPFELDTVYPEVTVTTPFQLFSPNDDGNKDALTLSIQASTETLWSANISDSENKSVRSFTWEDKAQTFDWDGKDEAGNIVADGTYSFSIESTDAAGNAVEAVIANIEVDNRKATAYVTVEREAFSPNGDGYLDDQEFAIRTTVADGIDSWAFTIVDNTTGKTVREWNQNDQTDVPATIMWDGATSDGTIAAGILTANLTLDYTKGDIVSVTTSTFLCSVTSPQLTVRTAPEYFSPDNDGIDDDLFISLQGNSIVPFTSWSFEIKDPQNGTTFWQTSGKASITERIIWDGRSNTGELVQSAIDYPYTFTVTDSLGMTSTVEGIIPVDVLVIRIGDVLKMQVPAIIFRSDNADFMGKGEDPERGLEQSVIDNNLRVLKRIAEILNKFSDYNVVIEGHANNLSGTEQEEISTARGNIPLVPLSEERAETVKDILVSYGVAQNRLSTLGMGGRVPVAARNDRDNWWKNRRVEFILEK